MYVILPPKWHQLPFTLEFYFTRTSCWLVQAYTSITVYGWGELFSVNVDKHCSFTKQHAAYLIRCLWFQNTARIFAHIFWTLISYGKKVLWCRSQDSISFSSKRSTWTTIMLMQKFRRSLRDEGQTSLTMGNLLTISVTRLGNLLQFGRLLKLIGNYPNKTEWASEASSLRFERGRKNGV